MAAPSNVWTVEPSAGDPSDPWPEGVRAERLLDRPPGTKLVAGVWELDPGAASPAYHVHHAAEELLLVLRGQPTLRTPEGQRPLAEGDVVHFPIGRAGAHQILNQSSATVRYVMVAAHSPLDIIEYVDEAKIVGYSRAESLLVETPLFFEHQLPRDE
jgi:uncharacterized cupin superfamily protein